MPPPPRRRSYTQRLRAESSAGTRQRIVSAARDALTARPLQNPTVAEVAERAGVVRSTVYTAFGSREGLLRAVVADVNARGGWARMQEAFRHPDALTAIVRNLEEGARMIGSGAAVASAITALAAVDPDAATVAAEIDAVRLRGVRDLVRRLDEQGGLRPGLSREQAVDVLWVLTSWGTYDQLATGRGLDPEAVGARLVDIAVRTICPLPEPAHDHRQDQHRTVVDR
ncbi:TetR/AcrR family transcriptional regulator [Geodermatophilus sabuli]|uniref:TetR/AcrR family transcriptional regulator n=1 Tax=Geodermatophilus sabuli TaxID=1564158 RepID=A0A7K3W0C9_9ACTN|nr:TetR/AcrR family transcriptional regulator [Geodermatophilus sabuli]NEK58325.1 TetR/AcrR family transcriptional regulator [Geodermatophilus sabuli]